MKLRSAVRTAGYAITYIFVTLLTACSTTRMSKDELRRGIAAGTLPPISVDSTLVDRSSFFLTRKIVLREKIAELRSDGGEAVLAAVGSKRGFPAGESINRTFYDPESIAILGEDEARTHGRVRYTISATGGRGASFGPCANMRELLVIDGKAAIDAPHQYCRQLTAR